MNVTVKARSVSAPEGWILGYLLSVSLDLFQSCPSSEDLVVWGTLGVVLEKKNWGRGPHHMARRILVP